MPVFYAADKSKHKKLQIRSCGAAVEKPYLGASPKGLITYLCCSDAVLEIKCPLSCKNLPVTNAMKNINIFWWPTQTKKEPRKLRKKFKHRWLLQVYIEQSVSYTGAEVHSEILYIDEEFLKRAVVNTESYFLTSVLNEIQTREIHQEIDVKRICLFAGGVQALCLFP